MATEQEWTLDELIDALVPASDHVREILGQLVRNGECTLKEVGTPPVAVALVERICKGRHRRPLLVRRRASGVTRYAVRDDIEGLVATALAYEGRVPRRPSRRAVARPGTLETARRSPRELGSPHPSPDDARHPDARELQIPTSVSSEFVMELLQFLRSCSDTRFEVVYDGWKAVLRVTKVADPASPKAR